MADRPVVFIASSTEGYEAAEELGEGLKAMSVERIRADPSWPFGELEVKVWPPQFQLGQFYLESLETAMKLADFAVVVAKADDPTEVRKVEYTAPRDNVIFELGLFMGHLGRERAYLVHEERLDLKLPSDLDGLKVGSYKWFKRRDPGNAVDEPCGAILDRIRHEGVRESKLSKHDLARIEEIRKFNRSVAGSWWGFRHWSKQTLSYVKISPEPSFLGLQVEGWVYNRTGEVEAHWNSLAACVSSAGRKLHFAFSGDRPVEPGQEGGPGEPSEDESDVHEYVGFTTYTFDSADGRFKTGHGKFFDRNLTASRFSARRPELERCSEEEIQVMDADSAISRRERIAQIVQRRLDSKWASVI